MFLAEFLRSASIFNAVFNIKQNVDETYCSRVLYVVCIILSRDLNIELEITTTCCSSKILSSILWSHKFAPSSIFTRVLE